VPLLASATQADPWLFRSDLPLQLRWVGRILRRKLVAQDFRHRVGLVMSGEAIHDRGAGFVEPDHPDFDTRLAKLEHGDVDGIDACEVPDMGLAHVDVYRFDAKNNCPSIR
jgi:hypothetical protein